MWFEDHIKFIKAGDYARVKLIPLKPLYVELFDVYPVLGRVVMMDNNHIVAVGVVKSVFLG